MRDRENKNEKALKRVKVRECEKERERISEWESVGESEREIEDRNEKV